jgi:predicted aconitase
VTKATVFCGAHNYLNVCRSEQFHEVFSRMHLGIEEIVPFTEVDPDCDVQSCVSPCEQFSWEPMGQTEAFFRKNAHFLAEAGKAGVAIAGTCAPYLTGWLPVRGEHFVTTESGVTVIGNAIWGAMGNADGVEAAFWSAICGRTPRWGNHVSENRAGTHVVRVEAAVDRLFDWDLLGAAVGSAVPGGAVPVLDKGFAGVTFTKLRQFCTSLAITSNCEMCHIVGITPEARSVEDALMGRRAMDVLTISARQMEDAYRAVCDDGDADLDLVSLGCPHYDIQQIREVAAFLEGRKVHPGVHFMVWTVYPIKGMADENGYTDIIEKAGGRIYTSTCPTTVGPALLDRYGSLLFDSLKQAASVKSCSTARIFVGDVRQCLEAAVSGRWEEERRWKPS